MMPKHKKKGSYAAALEAVRFLKKRKWGIINEENETDCLKSAFCTRHLIESVIYLRRRGWRIESLKAIKEIDLAKKIYNKNI